MGLQKIQIFFGVLDILDIFGGKQQMLGPSLRMKDESAPPPHTHSHGVAMRVLIRSIPARPFFVEFEFSRRQRQLSSVSPKHYVLYASCCNI